MKRTCIECGKEFETTSSRRNICYEDHYRTCAICGNSFLATADKIHNDVKTCSKQCTQKQMAISQREVVPTIARVCKYCGKEFQSRNPNAYICNRTHELTCVVCGSTFWIRNYGVDNPSKSIDILSNFISDGSKLTNYASFHQDPRAFIESEFIDHTPTLGEVAKVCGIRDSSVGQILIAAQCTDLIQYSYSAMEDEIYLFLRSELGETEEIVRNSYQVIKPKEVDIYLSRFKLAIECNPTCTHNSSIGAFGSSDSPKSANYHKSKSDDCKDKGIFLFHLFGYDWSTKPEVIKSMLRNLIGTTPNRVYGRCTEIKEIDYLTCKEFLESNHRQGSTTCKIRLGLYYNNVLVSVMTFSSMRHTIGTGKEDLSNCYELSRFCNLINTNVVGGASKLFKYFVDNYSPTQVRSFSDRAHTKGNLYPQLSFTEVRSSDANYVWVEYRTDRPVSRLNAQKQNIKAFLKDDSIDLSKSEKEIMVAHGYVQVFDSGTITWEWVPNKSLSTIK